ncbi:MAG: addiction module protein [Spirochaetota bacterium]|nr:addiction module protein [Spirochaetota bacterium]
MKKIADEVAGMSIEDKIILVEELWDSIAETPEKVEIPEWHKNQLKQRMEDYSSQQEKPRPWPDVKKSIPGE